MAKVSTKEELLGLEKQYWQAIKDGDVDAALRLTADPCIVTGARGVSQIDRASFKKMMTGVASYSVERFEFKDDVQFQQVSDDVAVLAYGVHEELMVEGKPLSFDAAESSTWVRRNGSWVCTAHTESLAGDPFGRDRRAPSLSADSA